MLRTDSAVRNDGMDALLKTLGKVDAERFISLIIKEPFDYTKWQSNIFSDKSVRELSDEAMRSIQS